MDNTISWKYEVGTMVKFKYTNQGRVENQDIGIIDSIYINDKLCDLSKLYITYLIKNKDQYTSKIDEKDIICTLKEVK